MTSARVDGTAPWPSITRIPTIRLPSVRPLRRSCSTKYATWPTVSPSTMMAPMPTSTTVSDGMAASSSVSSRNATRKRIVYGWSASGLRAAADLLGLFFSCAIFSAGLGATVYVLSLLL